jgi:hypothetical protein
MMISEVQGRDLGDRHCVMPCILFPGKYKYHCFNGLRLSGEYANPHILVFFSKKYENVLDEYKYALVLIYLTKLYSIRTRHVVEYEDLLHIQDFGIYGRDFAQFAYPEANVRGYEPYFKTWWREYTEDDIRRYLIRSGFFNEDDIYWIAADIYVNMPYGNYYRAD